MRLKSISPAIIVLAILLPLSTVSASVIINFNMGVIRDYNGNPVSTDNGGTLGVLVADTGGHGFLSGDALLGTTLTAGNSLGTGSGNLIIQTFNAKLFSFGTPDPQYDTQFRESFNPDATVNPTSLLATLPVNTKLAIYWFPGITASGTTLSAANITPLSINNKFYYGFYRTDSVDTTVGSEIGYVVPGDGSWSLITWDQVAYDDPNALATQANLSALNFIAIPEPSSWVMLLGGTLTLGTWLRRRRTA